MTDPQEIARQLAALLGQRLALQADAAGGGLHQPGQQAQQAGLAAAVGAADLQHVAGLQMKMQVFEEHAPIPLTAERHGFEKGVGTGHRYLAGLKSAVSRPLY